MTEMPPITDNPARGLGPPGERIRVRGLVQGVGFRPTVWRLARRLGLRGDVCNDGEGVLIRAWGAPRQIDAFCAALRAECPPLAHIDSLERGPLGDFPAAIQAGGGFHILASAAGFVGTGVVPDAATCPACAAEVADPADRRYRYPFTNCTHCGPRLSIVRAIPYDRANTSMAAFPMCPACAAEYADPADRRFHAQPNACPACGPCVWLQDGAGGAIDPADLGAQDPIKAASRLLAQGRILAVKGIGGFHLACDACNAAAVAELRRRKRRYAKPFALMARDLAVILRYCALDAGEATLLSSPAAPVVLLDATGPECVAPAVAPGQATLGFMLPYSPLHILLLAGWARPLVMTSGNLSDEPQCTDNRDAGQRLAGLADAYLLHDREIVNRVDDSVVRVMDGAPRLLRRARGYAPAPVALPTGFADAPPTLALGGELKSTVCLLKGGQATLSQHLGDLEDATTALDYERSIGLYLDLFQHAPRLLAVDRHPGYRSAQLGRDWAARDGLELTEVQHHHAHIAAVLADNAWPLDGGPVLGLALDGLGYGDDGTVWGGELLLADYRRCRRLGWLKPVPLPGGVKAMTEPWRNAYAQLSVHLGWSAVLAGWPDLDLTRYLGAKPLVVLDTMMARGFNSPRSSSCGRLFDAVAAAVGICREQTVYEGQAAIELEAAARPYLEACGPGYPFALADGDGGLFLDPAPLWRALLADLALGEAAGAMAARFHLGLAGALAAAAAALAGRQGVAVCALSGGVFQNRTLFESLSVRLRASGLTVLAHRQVPANDGGISLGQAVVAAARRMA
jgi:hydrogenase maturation protein HypF